MKKVLISACLTGQPVRYDGGEKRWPDPILKTWAAEGRLVPVCPEVEGGLSIPRPPAEISGGVGLEVWRGEASVITRDGRDVTNHFLKGAEFCLQLVREQCCVLAIFTEKSPSCGSEFSYNGSFSGELRKGGGVTTALLEKAGIRVFSQHRLKEAQDYLRSLG